MALVSGIADRLDSLVHDSARGDRVEYLRHLTFIAGRLLVSLAALASLPPYLALRGAPSLVDALVFAVVMGPAAGALWVSRTGNLRAGHTFCIVSLLALAAILSIGSAAAAPASLIWLILAPLEAYLTGARKIVLATMAASIAVVAGISGLKLAGIGAGVAGASGAASIFMAVLAIGYGSMLVLGATGVDERARQEANVNFDRYRGLTEAIGDLVLRLDRSGAVYFVSSNCEALSSLPGNELMARGLFDRIHVADRPAFLKAITDAADGDGVVCATVRLRTPPTTGDGHGVHFSWMELRANRTRGVRGHDCSVRNDTVLVVARDVSRLKDQEQSLDDARQEADRAALWKDRFLANVSHELRTPLNAIIGFAEVLGNKDIAPSDPEKIREYANIIHESGEHLLAVVNQILDISKIEAGSFEIIPESFPAAELVDNCLGMLQLRAAKGGVAIRRDFHPAVRDLVADKRSIKQVLINLISNAIKFTPEGGAVTIGLRPEGNSLVFTVTDTGIGIGESYLPRLGAPFFQAAGTIDRAYEGTGLGLSVVRGLVGLHGGAIRIESAPAHGTRVTVKLPVDGCSVTGTGKTADIEALPLKAEPSPASGVETIEVRRIA